MRAKLLGLGVGGYAFLLAAYALGLAASAPATLLDAALRSASEGRLRLAEARGTLWSGTGQLEARDASRRSGVAKAVAWRFVPQSLLRARAEFEIRTEDSSRRFAVSLAPSRIEIVDAEVSLPGELLGLAVPKLAPLRLAGELRLRVARLSIAERGGMQGGATLQWRGAGSALTPVAPLGDYELRLEGNGTAVRASLRTLVGPLRLEGSGSWTPGANPAFLGTARVAPEFRMQLEPLLRLIAVERGDGSFELQLK